MITYDPPINKDLLPIYLKLAKDGNKLARDKIILSNQALINAIINSVVGGGFLFSNKDDLMNEGTVGLNVAIDKYMLGSDCSFITYAVFWIRSYINKYIHQNKSIVHIVNTVNIDKSKDQSELTDYRKESIKLAKELIVYDQYVESESGDVVNIFDKIPDESTDMDSMEVDYKLFGIPKSNSKILDLLLNKDYSRTEVGGILGVSRERVRQLYTSSLSKVIRKMNLYKPSLVNKTLGIELTPIDPRGGYNYCERLLWNDESSIPTRYIAKYSNRKELWITQFGTTFNFASRIPNKSISRISFYRFLEHWIKKFESLKIPIKYEFNSSNTDDWYLSIVDLYKIVLVGIQIHIYKINESSILKFNEISKASKELRVIARKLKFVYK